MGGEPKTYAELRAHYLAVKNRLGGVAGPTGVVPIVQLDKPQERPRKEEDQRFLAVHVPKSQFIKMLREAAEIHGMDPEIVRMPTRKYDVIKVRQELYYRAKNELNLGYSLIGRMMNVSHSTVMHGIKQHEKKLAQHVKSW